MARKRNYYPNFKKAKPLTPFQKFCWVFFLVLFSIVFVGSLIFGIFKNCVFEWPIRWDFMSCVREQVDPAKENAFEKTSDFVPL